MNWATAAFFAPVVFFAIIDPVGAIVAAVGTLFVLFAGIWLLGKITPKK